MPLVNAWIFRCDCGCARNQVFQSLTKREAETAARVQGWCVLSGKWYAGSCASHVKRAHRLARRTQKAEARA